MFRKCIVSAVVVRMQLETLLILTMQMLNKAFKWIMTYRGRSFFPITNSDSANDANEEGIDIAAHFSIDPSDPHRIDLGRLMRDDEPEYCSKAFPNGKYLCDRGFEVECKKRCVRECDYCYRYRTEPFYKSVVLKWERGTTAGMWVSTIAAGLLGAAFDSELDIETRTLLGVAGAVLSVVGIMIFLYYKE